jgi:transcriptional regulator with XRE-family HTH domain
MLMKLETYLKEKGLTDDAFGKLIGKSQSQVSRIRRGVSWPPKDVIEAIATVTEGNVTANDILSPETAQ